MSGLLHGLLHGWSSSISPFKNGIYSGTCTLSEIWDSHYTISSCSYSQHSQHLHSFYLSLSIETWWTADICIVQAAKSWFVILFETLRPDSWLLCDASCVLCEAWNLTREMRLKELYRRKLDKSRIKALSNKTEVSPKSDKSWSTCHWLHLSTRFVALGPWLNTQCIVVRPLHFAFHFQALLKHADSWKPVVTKNKKNINSNQESGGKWRSREIWQKPCQKHKYFFTKENTRKKQEKQHGERFWTESTFDIKAKASQATCSRFDMCLLPGEKQRLYGILHVTSIVTISWHWRVCGIRIPILFNDYCIFYCNSSRLRLNAIESWRLQLGAKMASCIQMRDLMELMLSFREFNRHLPRLPDLAVRCSFLPWNPCVFVHFAHSVEVWEQRHRKECLPRRLEGIFGSQILG